MFSWTREEIPAAIMSASSGPKDYLKNQAHALLSANPAFDLVLLLRARGPLFLLARTVDGAWCDVTGKQVVRG